MLLSIVTSCPVHVICLSSSLNEVLLACHAIFNFSVTIICTRRLAHRGTYLQTVGIFFCILSTENSFSKFKMK